MKKFFLSVLSAATLMLNAADFEHSLSGTKPWSNEKFLNDSQEFQFAIVGDRTGGERKGYFQEAMGMLNLLRPEFVMSVGDLINGSGDEKEFRRQWIELRGFIDQLEMPFFYVVGNHDILTGFSGMTKARQQSIDMWKEYCGTNTYYSFKYKNCLFICLDSMETHDYYPARNPLPESQMIWAANEFEKHKDVRWRFIFMHKPLDWTSDSWLRFERKINKYDYTVFCGDWHNHIKVVRHGKIYYALGTTGGGIGGNVRDDLRGGYMDAITWVTMTKKGPVVANLALSGIHGDDIQRCATTKGWIEAPLDYPSHRAENPAKYRNEKNTALIPVDVASGPGYDWHFLHARKLRQALMTKLKYEKMPPGDRKVVLLGDETASDFAREYPKDKIFDLGFKGDKIQNVLWRVIEGELDNFDPAIVVISVGKHNRAENTPEEIQAGLKKLESYAREYAPNATIVVK